MTEACAHSFAAVDGSSALPLRALMLLPTNTDKAVWSKRLWTHGMHKTEKTEACPVIAALDVQCSPTDRDVCGNDGFASQPGYIMSS